jgi:hypothetical protein
MSNACDDEKMYMRSEKTEANITPETPARANRNYAVKEGRAAEGKGDGRGIED